MRKIKNNNNKKKSTNERKHLRKEIIEFIAIISYKLLIRINDNEMFKY